MGGISTVATPTMRTTETCGFSMWWGINDLTSFWSCFEWSGFPKHQNAKWWFWGHFVFFVVQIIWAGGKAPESSTWHQRVQFHIKTSTWSHETCLHVNVAPSTLTNSPKQLVACHWTCNKNPWVLGKKWCVKCRKNSSCIFLLMESYIPMKCWATCHRISIRIYPTCLSLKHLHDDQSSYITDTRHQAPPWKKTTKTNGPSCV